PPRYCGTAVWTGRGVLIYLPFLPDAWADEEKTISGFVKVKSETTWKPEDFIKVAQEAVAVIEETQKEHTVRIVVESGIARVAHKPDGVRVVVEDRDYYDGPKIVAY